MGVRDFFIAAFAGGIAGVGIGFGVRAFAKSQLERSVVTGGADLDRSLREGRSDALERLPREVQRGIAAGIDDGLEQAGLSRRELRQYVSYARQLQELLRRFS